MTRFIAGTTDTETPWQPTGARQIPAVPGARLWSSGYRDDEITVFTAGGVRGARLGQCLATPTEQHDAARALASGRTVGWAMLPGTALTLAHRDGELWVAGDLVGTVTVYWTRHAGAWWWGTSARLLAALVGARVNPEILLTDMACSGVDAYTGDSLFTSIRRVPPGSALVTRPGSGTPRVEQLHAPANRDFRTGAIQLRRAVTTVVKRWVPSTEKVSADLSGGVDSSTLAALAAANADVLAVTYTDEHMATSQDVRYARRVAAAHDRISHRVINGQHASSAHYDGLRDVEALPFTETPSLSLALLAIKDAQMEPAVARGSTVHLTGRGGDNVLSAPPSHLVDLAMSGRRRPALARAARHAREYQTSPWPVWRQLVRTASTPYPRALGHLAESVRHPVRDSGGVSAGYLAWCGTTEVAHWLTGAGRDLVADVITQRAHTATPDALPGEVHQRLGIEFMGASHATYAEIARQRWSLAIAAPFLDNQVAATCLSIPTHQRSRPGTYKPLAHAAFTGLVPDFLLRRPGKTDFTNSMYAGIARNATALQGILTRSHLADAGLLDPRHPADALDRAVAGASAPLGALHSLLVTEIWLRQQTQVNSSWWTRDSQPEVTGS